MSITEVAKLAGVSHATVSRVINNHPSVSPRSVRRVQKAMKSLHYTPPAVRRGRAPKNGNGAAIRTGNVAMLFSGTTDPTLARSPVTAVGLHAIQDELARRGFNMIVGQISDASNPPPTVMSGHVDGLLMHGFPPTGPAGDLLRSMPCVWWLSQRRRIGYWGDRVAPDNVAIGVMAAQYLIDRGHENIALIHADPTHLGFAARAEGFQHAAEDVGVTAHVIVDRGFRENRLISDEAAERRAPSDFDHLFDQLIDLDPRPTGLFVPQDKFAALCYRGLRARGIEPGRDIDLIGCDNQQAILDGLDPKPATIDVRPDEIGRRAVEQLIWRMQNRHAPMSVLATIEPRLVEPDDSTCGKQGCTGSSSDQENGPVEGI